MTNREAIEWLAPDTSKLKINMAELNGENPLEYINEAINVAINALEEQEKRNIIIDFGTEKKDGILVQWNNDGSALVQIGNKFGTYNASQIKIGTLEEQEKRRWIPVSERLPEPYEDGSVDCVLITDGFFEWMAYFNLEGEWCFAECTNANKIIDWTEIIAWMPLPEPYTVK